MVHPVGGTGASETINTKKRKDLSPAFGEVAELKAAERVEIEGKIRSEALSPNTKYGAYLLFKINHHSYGLNSIPFETFLASNGRVIATNTAILHDPHDEKCHLYGLFCANRQQKMKEKVINEGNDAATTRTRDDSWLEIEVGEFFVGGVEEITMGVMENKGCHLKGGLIVEGIELRPKRLGGPISTRSSARLVANARSNTSLSWFLCDGVVLTS